MSAGFLVVACARCGARRVAEAGRKTAGCPRCGATIDLARGPPLFKGGNLEEAQAFMGAQAASAEGEGKRFARDVRPAAPAQDERQRERARIAQAVASASGRANQLKLILRRGFEAFGELTEEDLDAIAAQADMAATGAELAEAAVELGLAGRAGKGAVVPLRQGR